MKKYRTYLILKIITISGLSVGTGYLAGIQQYWIALLFFVILIYFIYNLFVFIKRNIKDTSRLIDAIRFSETNISFRRLESKGLPEELSLQMEEAVALLNKRLTQSAIEQQFYDTLLNRIDTAIIVFDKKGKIHWINKLALDLFGKPQPKHIADFQSIDPDLPVVLEKILPKENKIIKFMRNEQLYALAVSAVLFSSKGNELKLVSFKNIESVIEESESEAWKKLTRVLTHEIMNSLTPIISLSESLSENEINEEEKQSLMNRAMQSIHRRSKGLVEFVQSYQQLTRIPEPVLRQESIRRILEDITGLMQAENIRFLFEIKGEDLLMLIDRIQIEQVLINLIKNAWEACRDIDYPSVRLLISKDEYQRPVIQIFDNGHGILPEVMDKIFVPFFTTKTGGSGIGLSVCRQIMSMHGGIIMITSVPDHGTEVILRF